MQRRNWKKAVLILWACALAFGLTISVNQVQAAHSSCGSQCNSACGGRNCEAYEQVGCDCFWWCIDGTEGDSQCVL